ncbi:hypothetical protein AAMO2058_000604500 [Amorphochlora amoebiformis]
MTPPRRLHNSLHETKRETSFGLMPVLYSFTPSPRIPRRRRQKKRPVTERSFQQSLRQEKPSSSCTKSPWCATSKSGYHFERNSVFTVKNTKLTPRRQNESKCPSSSRKCDQRIDLRRFNLNMFESSSLGVRGLIPDPSPPPSSRRQAWTDSKDEMVVNAESNPVPKTFQEQTKRGKLIIKNRLQLERKEAVENSHKKFDEILKRRKASRQKFMNQKVKRAVLEEMAGQLRNTQEGFTGPVSSNSPKRERRSDGYGGFHNLVSGELEGADDTYSESAFHMGSVVAPSGRDQTDRMSIIVESQDHLSPEARDPMFARTKQKTWRRFRHKPTNSWNNHADISKKQLRFIVQPEKDREGLNSIQEKQKQMYVQEMEAREKKKNNISKIRELFIAQQEKNYKWETNVNPLLSVNRPPSQRPYASSLASQKTTPRLGNESKRSNSICSSPGNQSKLGSGRSPRN